MLSRTACESPPFDASPVQLTVRAVFAALLLSLLAVTLLRGPEPQAPGLPDIPVDSPLAYAE